MDAVQLIDWPPVFDNVNDWLEGLNGPPAVPEELRDPEDTDSAPAGVGAFTVRLTDRVAFPVPLVVFVNITVSV